MLNVSPPRLYLVTCVELGLASEIYISNRSLLKREIQSDYELNDYNVLRNACR